MKNFKIIITLALIATSCTKDNLVSFDIDRVNSSTDTLFIHETTSGKKLLTISPNTLTDKIALNGITIGSLGFSDKQPWLTILRPGFDKKIIIESDIVQTNDPGDSILNYIWHSNNDAIAQNSGQIFGDATPIEVKDIFENLIENRSNLIDKLSDQLSEDISLFLHYQNKARAYSFLFYYGRMMKNLEPSDPFFDFTNLVENENPFVFTLPDVVLYKYEVEYLRVYDSITSINTFIQFIEDKTTSKEIEYLLKIKYLQEVMESPSYWKRHLHIFNSNVLKEALIRETANPYLSLIDNARISFEATRNGEKAFNFKAIMANNTSVSLSDFQGQVVFIDVWASWCGPCISQRPNVIKLARKFYDNDKVAVLMISVDQSSSKWKKYVERTNPEGFGNELFVPGQFSSNFSKNYFISSIPRYILINKKGTIINANVAEPSASLEVQIESLLRSNE